MEVKLGNVIICGIRKFDRAEKDGKPQDPLYFLDWYCNGAYSSLINQDDLAEYQKLILKVVNMEVRIEERNNRVNYRILRVVAKQAS